MSAKNYNGKVPSLTTVDGLTLAGTSGKGTIVSTSKATQQVTIENATGPVSSGHQTNKNEVQTANEIIFHGKG